MLTKTDWKDVPPYGNQGRSPIRQFAYKTVIEFFENSEVGDVFEVTGYPEMSGNDAMRMAEKVRGAIRTELWHLSKDYDTRSDVNVFRRKGRLFMERKEPLNPVKIKPKPNPYPGDLPRVH